MPFALRRVPAPPPPPFPAAHPPSRRRRRRRSREIETRRATTPLRHPIIFHDLIFTTRNSKLAFHLRELQFAAGAASVAPVSLSAHSFPFIPIRTLFDSFRRDSRPVTFQSVAGPHRLYYVSRVFFAVFLRRPFSPIVHRPKRAVFCPA